MTMFIQLRDPICMQILETYYRAGEDFCQEDLQMMLVLRPGSFLTVKHRGYSTTSLPMLDLQTLSRPMWHSKQEPQVCHSTGLEFGYAQYASLCRDVEKQERRIIHTSATAQARFKLCSIPSALLTVVENYIVYQRCPQLAPLIGSQ